MDPSTGPSPNPDTLVLSGGGTLMYAHLGAVWCLDSSGILGRVHRFVGVSAGAIVALLLVAGLTVPDLSEQIFNIDFYELQRLSPLNLVASYGLDTGHLLIAKVRDALEAQGWSRNVTFGQLKSRTGKDLVIGVTEVTSRRFRFLTPDTHPDLAVCTALRASISIPLLYTPVSIQNSLYVDGGLMDNFPLGRTLRQWPECRALGVQLRVHAERDRQIRGIMDYAVAVFSCIAAANEETFLEDSGASSQQRSSWKVSVDLDVSFAAIIESPTYERKRELFAKGFSAAEALCQGQGSNTNEA